MTSTNIGICEIVGFVEIVHGSKTIIMPPCQKPLVQISTIILCSDVMTIQKSFNIRKDNLLYLQYPLFLRHDQELKFQFQHTKLA